jgi:ERCC4-type nuclease
MFIKIDFREKDLINQIKSLISSTPCFNHITMVEENLPIGDIIIANEKEEKLIIERKTLSDLMASIKDGRYEEQSYRLNGLPHHNHNIIYLIEGEVGQRKAFKFYNNKNTNVNNSNNHQATNEKLITYSAMFSLNYYKGFSLFRTINLEESAMVICNMCYKIEKEIGLGKKEAFYNTNSYTNTETNTNTNTETNTNVDANKKEESQEKDYVNVVKKIKKENITKQNIGEIMLCQIPGISAITASAIIEKYKSIQLLIKELETNKNCLANISYTTKTGQQRKISKTCIVNIVNYLVD